MIAKVSSGMTAAASFIGQHRTATVLLTIAVASAVFLTLLNVGVGPFHLSSASVTTLDASLGALSPMGLICGSLSYIIVKSLQNADKDAKKSPSPTTQTMKGKDLERVWEDSSTQSSE